MVEAAKRYPATLSWTSLDAINAATARSRAKTKKMAPKRATGTPATLPNRLE